MPACTMVSATTATLTGDEQAMTKNNESGEHRSARELPMSVVIPPIRGEMVHLRPATVGDLARMDELKAYAGAAKITGKDEAAERAAVQVWVRRSEAWVAGQAPEESGVGDPESRRTMAWAIIKDVEQDDEAPQSADEDVIGMIFLIDIDGWARSARIQVVLGKDYRGRGYSRDAMPRVMTYGFAPEPAGLGMHRIWVAVPESNSRSRSVYQSLGFMPSGTSRDALWDDENGKYQDLIVMDTLADEFDPIRSLDAFGMHVLEDNPGMKEALSAREHSLAIRQNTPENTQDDVDTAEQPIIKQVAEDEQPNWPYGQNEHKTKEAWWRTLGRGRTRDAEEEQ